MDKPLPRHRLNQKTNRSWLTIREAAVYFSLSQKTLYSLAARGMLPDGAILRLGRQIRINAGIIEEMAGMDRKRM